MQLLERSCGVHDAARDRLGFADFGFGGLASLTALRDMGIRFVNFSDVRFCLEYDVASSAFAFDQVRFCLNNDVLGFHEARFELFDGIFRTADGKLRSAYLGIDLSA